MIGISELPKNPPVAIADYPFKGYVDWLFGEATASSYDLALNTIWLRVNQGGLLESIRQEAVEKTINTYSNLLKGNISIPVYNWWYVEKEPRKEYVDMVNLISNKSGVKVAEVKQILKQLQSADNDGSIVKGIYNPRTIDKVASSTPDNADSFKNKLDVEKYLKWGLIGLGAFAVIKVISLVD